MVMMMIMRRLYGQLADKPTRRQTNSPTNQLTDNSIRPQPTLRQTNSPTNKLAEIDILVITFRLTPKSNGNYESSALSL